MVTKRFAGPGRCAPALLCLALAIGAAPAWGQAPVPAAPPPASQAGVPDTLTVHRLVWSMMAALDQANQTGNYSVLRDLGAPGFQASNSAATLGGIFANIRNQNIDLSYTL